MRKIGLGGRCVSLVGIVELLGLLVVREAKAHCNQQEIQVDSSDRALYDLHGCDMPFIQWHSRAMNLDERADWWDRGADTGYCDIRYEYAKAWNASWLVIAMPPAFQGSTLSRPFHHKDDYGSLTFGQDTDWHDAFKYKITDSVEVSGQLWHNPFSINELVTTCSLYHYVPQNVFGSRAGRVHSMNTVSERAIAYIHEAHHAWQEKNASFIAWPVPGHEFNPQTEPVVPSSCTNGVECDYYNPHTKENWGPGQLLHATTAKTWHSTFQVELESACDLADSSSDIIPYIVKETAAWVAKIAARSDFANTVPFSCGSTRPFWTKDRSVIKTPVPWCLDTTKDECSTQGVCPGGRTCGDDGCCRPACKVTGLDDCSTAACTGGRYCANDGCCVPQCAKSWRQCLAASGGGSNCSNGCATWSGCCINDCSYSSPYTQCISDNQGNTNCSYACDEETGCCN